MLTFKKNRPVNFLIHMVFTALSISCIVPILLVIVLSFSDTSSIAGKGYSLFPTKWSLDAYNFILRTPWVIMDSYATTLLVTAVGTAAGLIITAMLAYALSRRDYVLASVFGFLVFFSMLFNAGLIPSYIVYTKYYHLKDTLWILILPGLVSSWNVILLRTFFFEIPGEILESASIDGSSEMRTFWQIVMPISTSALATIGLFITLSYWNEWTRSMIYIDTQSKYMLQYLLYKILREAEQMLKDAQMGLSLGETEFPTDTAKMSMAVLAAGPMMFVFPFFQKYFVRGISSGAVKG